MSLTKPQLIFIGVFSLLVVIFGLIFAGVLPGLQQKKTQQPKIKAELNFWVLYDNQKAYEKAFNSFRAIYPEVKINFRSFSDPEVYEKALLEALAAGAGPDIFVIDNNSLPRHLQKIAPLPPEKLSLLRLRQLFPQTVEQSFVSAGNIFALPLFVDTLVLYYNRDLLAQAQIPAPPETWEEFESIVPRLTKIGEGGKIIQSAVALGGTKNIDEAADILSLLMLQTGTQMISPDFRKAIFATKEGENALNFYTQFADLRKKLYSWNNTLPNSIDAFTNEIVAMIFGYSSTREKIIAKNPFLNFAVAPMPHPASAQKWPAYAKYFGYTVSRQSRYQNIAWDFIIQMTTVKDNVISYLEATKRPPALLDLANQILEDPEFAAFAKQVFIAKNWPQIDPSRIREIFINMIESVTTSRTTVQKALSNAEAEVNALMGRR
jgi:multiple sugar transport system substrate-binding protein